MKRFLSLFVVLMLLLSVVACSQPAPAPQEIIDEAAEMIYEYNKPGEDNQVTSSFERIAVTEYEGYKINIDWAVEGISEEFVKVVPADNDKVKIVVNKYVDEDKAFTLKATLKSGSNSKTVSFNYTMKQFVINDWQYWADNTKDVTMNIRGIVVAKSPFANNSVSLYLQDLDGQHGYYAYACVCASQSAYDTDLAIGNVVEINGKTSLYNNLREFAKGCTYSVVTNEDGTTKTADVKKIAIDDIFTDDAKLNPLQGCIVTLSGAKVKSIDVNTALNESTGAGSVYVVLEKGGNTIKSYLSTSNTFTYAQLVAELDKLAVGYTVNLEGPMAWYNAPQIYPCPGSFTVTSKEVSAEDKITSSLTAISIPSSVEENTAIDLPAKGAYDDVALTWAITAGEANAAIADGKLNLTLASSTTSVTLKLTATCGSAVQEKEYQIKLVVGEMSYTEIVNAAYALEEGKALDGTYRLYGVISKIDTPYDEKYGNITVTIIVDGIEDKPIQCFRLQGDGVADLKEGDDITVSGVLKNYKGTVEFDAKCALIGHGEIIDQSKTVELAYGLAENEAMASKVLLSGVISKIDTAYSEQYGNITVTIIVDGIEDKPIQCFRLQGEGCANLKEGDSIAVYGLIKNYKGTIEFDAKCQLVSYENFMGVRSILAAYNLDQGAALTGTSKVTGKITKIDTAYSEQYGNITVTIVANDLADFPVQCFRMKGDGCADLKEGDIITVSGLLKNYKGTIEFDTGCQLIK